MKRSYAFFTSFFGLAAVTLIAASIGTETWALIKIERNSSEPCTVDRKLGLFNGLDSYNCTLNPVPEQYSIVTPGILSIEVGLFYATIAIAAVAIFFGLVAFGVAGYNLFSRPYETWAGPVGLITYFSCGLISNFVCVILFLITGFVDINDTVPTICPGNVEATIVVCKDEGFSQASWEFGYSFYILLAALAPFIFGIILVLVAGKSLINKIKNKLCPGAMEETVAMDGTDNTMMF